ncbi:aldo/keto reductase [Pseudomonas sp. MYb185]|uniref:aldo/keto reductase n=1 Tax=Pseudomonas sp. MYb185 TaxID=1848729 RepID=UPI000CFB086F|nr:aldo/keto reductase [Pseudomonas sp. MYb185]PRB80022.1 aldo/keto reductase [Pseudomonas sp. MYb185]
MQYTQLGNTGLTVSRLALGTMTFGYQTDESTAARILGKAADAGITFLDTADVYPLGGGLERVGRTEEIVGRWLHGQRDNFIVATKFVGAVGSRPWNQGASRKHIHEAVNASLTRLNTDYIDLYQLHSDDPATPLDETLYTLDTLIHSGKVRYIGVSNFLAYRLALALGRSDIHRYSRFVSVQPRYSLLFREIERELLPLAQEQGVGVIPYNPLAGGLLTGKHRYGAPTEGTRFTLGTAAERYQQRYWHERQFETVQTLASLSDSVGLSLTTAAVAWVLANPVVTSAIIGASNPAQLDATLAAINTPLPFELKQRFDELTQEYRKGDAAR